MRKLLQNNLLEILDLRKMKQMRGWNMRLILHQRMSNLSDDFLQTLQTDEDFTEPLLLM